MCHSFSSSGGRLGYRGMGKGDLKIEEKKGWNENEPKIEISITPSSRKRRSLELCHTSRQFGGPHQELEQSGVEWGHPLGCSPKDLDDKHHTE
jgi:hypothetical protein